MNSKKTNLLLIACALISCASPLLKAAELPDDPFAPYLDTPAPENREIQAPPKITAPPAGVTARNVFYKSLTRQTPEGPDTNEIHAVIARPENVSGPLPGLLVMHGGHGFASFKDAYKWAQRGYLAVAIDLPGIGFNDDMASTGAWRSYDYGAGRWKADPNATASVLFDAVVAGIDGFKLLQSLPEADKGKLGIVGISWGGYMTTMLSGLLGDQVEASFSIFGTGFYEKTVFVNNLAQLPDAERERWFTYLDAGRRAENIKSAFFTAGAVCDHFFYPTAVKATQDEIPGDRKRFVLVPNANHSLREKGKGGMDFGSQEKIWFDHFLKGEGEAFPVITVSDSKAVKFKVDSSRPLVRVQIVHTSGSEGWEKHQWQTVDAKPDGEGAYSAEIPGLGEGVLWYVLAVDDRTFGVSSEVFGVAD